MTEGQSTPQQAPPIAQAPLKSQKIPDIVDTFRPSKVGASEHLMIQHPANNACLIGIPPLQKRPIEICDIFGL